MVILKQKLFFLDWGLNSRSLAFHARMLPFYHPDLPGQVKIGILFYLDPLPADSAAISRVCLSRETTCNYFKIGFLFSWLHTHTHTTVMAD